MTSNKFFNKYIITTVSIFIGSFILNWIAIKIAPYFIDIIEKLLILFKLDESIFYLFSEILTCAALGFLSFIVVIKFIEIINKNVNIPNISIIIPLLCKIIYWSIHIYYIYPLLNQLINISIIKTLTIVLSMFTPDIVFFILIFYLDNNIK